MKAFFPDGKYQKSMSYLVGLLCLLIYLPTRVYSQQDEAAYFKELYKPVHHTISETNAFILERIEMEGADTRFPFLHFRQKAANEIRYVILLHEIDGSKNNWNESEARIPMHSTLRDSLLNLGFNLLIPDLKFHGERAAELPGQKPAELHPANTDNAEEAFRYYRLLSDSKIDINYLMNYISSLPGNDVVGYHLIGWGMGGSIAVENALTDKRVINVAAINTAVGEPYASVKDKNWSEEDKSFFLEVTPDYALVNNPREVLLIFDDAKHAHELNQNAETFKNYTGKISVIRSNENFERELTGLLLNWLR